MKAWDQGGCMLAMHTGGGHMFPSKTDHIMSRYRPIAPKPMPKPEGTEQTDSHSLSSLSADKSTTKSTEYKGSKRSRKRPPTDSAKSSPRSQQNQLQQQAKRTRNGTSAGSTSGKSSGGVAETNVEFQPASFNLTPIFSDRVAPVFGPGGLQRFKESFDHTQNGVSVSLSLAAKPLPAAMPAGAGGSDAFYSHQMGSINLNHAVMCSRDGLSFHIGGSNHEAGLKRDMGFMERAAASAPVLFPAAAPAETSHIHSLRKEQLSLACASVSTSFGADSEVCSGEDAAESGRPSLVTLSLLPDTPSHVYTHSTSSGSTLSLFSSDMRSPREKQQATSSSNLDTNLTMSSNKGRWPEHEDATNPRRECVPESFGPVAARAFVERLSDGDCGRRVVDLNYLEQRHGSSSEAVILTDELDRVLWANTAFKRASSERMSGRMQSIGPHIDPLGIRTQLALLTFQPPFLGLKCKAVLWGFLKKFIFHEVGAQSHSNLSSDGQAKVIAPQPVRAVGSTISLQSIVHSDPHAAPLTESFESVQERLERGEMPSIITDARHRVRWVNTAYKRMVGQPKCAWLASTVGGGATAAAIDEEEDSSSIAQLRLAGEVSLVCDGAQPPANAAFFSCRVLIRWSHQSDHNATSMTSEVVRLDDGASGSMFVWGFDISDAGVKNLLQIEKAGPFC